MSERFWAKVDRRDDDDCWEWKASRLPNGYGQFQGTTAHRMSFELQSGSRLPDNLVVDHLCRNRGCVNPRHLEPVPQAVNVRRGDLMTVAPLGAKKRSAERTHCSHGHRMTDENTYSAPSNPTWRVCRTCKRENGRKWRQRNIG